MKIILNFLDFNYDNYIVYLCIIALVSFAAYALLKPAATTRKTWTTLSFILGFVSVLIILIGSITYLNSDSGSETVYRAQNDSLQTVNKSLLTENDSLRVLIVKKDSAITISDDKLKTYIIELNNSKTKYNEKINATDHFSSDDIDSYFTNYSTRYFEKYSTK